MKRIKLIIVSLVSLIGLTALPLWAKVTASVDRTDIAVGETFVLDIRGDGSQGGQPDLSLIPKEITIISNSQYSHTQISNGKRSVIVGWKLKLKTLDPGQLTIPPITVGRDSTQAIKLNIRDASNQLDMNGESKLIYIEAETDYQKAYVQQQIVFRVKLYRAVQTHYASLSDPKAENAIVEKLGDDIQYEKYIGGRRYVVTERKYAIFPQESGGLKIAGVNFSADVADSSRRNRSSFLSSTRPVSLSTKPIDIDVRPRPAIATEPWLPASKVILVDKWTPNNQTLTVGEPVTWTLLLSVQGLSESQLPEINIPEVEGLQWYADAPQKERQINDDGVLGQRIEKLAVIPSRDGQISIPEITLNWWDVNQDKQQTVTLPARTFTVQPATSQAAESSIISSPPAITPESGSGISQHELRRWQYIAVAMMVLWLLTLVAYFRKPKENVAARNTQPALKQQPADAKSWENQAKKAIDNKNPAELEKALLAWINACGYPHIHSIGSMVQHINDESLANKLRQLERLRYSASQQEILLPLQKSDLGKIFQEISQQQENQVSSSIPPLYPR